MEALKTFIVCTLQVSGVHRWAGCKDAQVSYLANLHRHQFFIKVKKQVSHLDREIEIISFKTKISNYLRKYYNGLLCLHNFGNRSCEQIATELLEHFELDECEVLEDNENGAVVVK